MAQAEAGAQGGSDASITGISRKFNPAISLNGLFYGMGTSSNQESADEFEPGIHIQEIELALSANVDAYLRADATLTSEGEGVSIETAYLTTLQLPYRLEAKVGKFQVPFGLNNTYHTHVNPFVERPLISEAIFGPETWSDMGASVSWLAPLPWYLTVTAGGFDGEGDGLFSSDRKGDYAGFGRVETLFDLGDSATFRAGGSFAWGPTLLESDTSTIKSQYVNDQVYGADLQFKWRPPKYLRSRGLVLQSEYLEQRYQRDDGRFDDPRKGYYVMALGQVSQYWWLQARYDWMREPREFDYPTATAMEDAQTDQRMSYVVALVPNHFQAYKLEYSVISRGGNMEYRTFFQVNYSIGSHPAHQY
jgi:hypothetical protein